MQDGCLSFPCNLFCWVFECFALMNGQVDWRNCLVLGQCFFPELLSLSDACTSCTPTLMPQTFLEKLMVPPSVLLCSFDVWAASVLIFKSTLINQNDSDYFVYFCGYIYLCVLLLRFEEASHQPLFTNLGLARSALLLPASSVEAADKSSL